MILAAMAFSILLQGGDVEPSGLTDPQLITAIFAGLTGLLVAVAGLWVTIRTNKSVTTTKQEVAVVREQNNGRVDAMIERQRIADARIEQLIVQLGKSNLPVPDPPAVVVPTV